MTADAREIEMILNNLLSNAVKYNRDGGRIELTIVRRDAEVAISVSDTGIGITPDEIARLGGEFVRIRNEQTHAISAADSGCRRQEAAALRRRHGHREPAGRWQPIHRRADDAVEEAAA